MIYTPTPSDLDTISYEITQSHLKQTDIVALNDTIRTLLDNSPSHQLAVQTLTTQLKDQIMALPVQHRFVVSLHISQLTPDYSFWIRSLNFEGRLPNIRHAQTADGHRLQTLSNPIISLVNRFFY